MYRGADGTLNFLDPMVVRERMDICDGTYCTKLTWSRGTVYGGEEKRERRRGKAQDTIFTERAYRIAITRLSLYKIGAKKIVMLCLRIMYCQTA